MTNDNIELLESSLVNQAALGDTHVGQAAEPTELMLKTQQHSTN
ncbi:hypothetical protein [Edaphobacter aggregans]|nr:hypothetical protein [Edaphobacter aggregans]